MRIWKRALADTEVQQAMRGQVRPDAEGLVGWWPLDDGFGLTARDLTPVSAGAGYFRVGDLPGECALLGDTSFLCVKEED